MKLFQVLVAGTILVSSMVFAGTSHVGQYGVVINSEEQTAGTADDQHGKQVGQGDEKKSGGLQEKIVQAGPGQHHRRRSRENCGRPFVTEPVPGFVYDHVAGDRSVERDY